MGLFSKIFKGAIKLSKKPAVKTMFKGGSRILKDPAKQYYQKRKNKK